MSAAKIVQIFQEGKAGGGFGVEEIRDWDTKNMAALCYRH